MKAPTLLSTAAAAGLLLLFHPGGGAAAAAVGDVAPRACAADNCLRALRATQTPGRLEAARSFCAAYTATATATAAPTVPAYVADACGDDAARLSSACLCIGTASGTSSVSSTVPSVSSTVSSSVSSSVSSPPVSSVSSVSSTVSSNVTSSTVSSISSVSSTPSSSEEPCAIASRAWASAVAAAPSAVVTLPAELAHACLASAPLHAEAAVELVDAIVPYLEWQSDAAYKADPPADYYPPAYDMYAELARVRAQAAAGAYASELAFQEDLYLSVFAAGRDGHLVFYPDLLTAAFRYGHGVALVSISDDATGGVPQIKLLDDVRAAPATAPAITHINGEPAAEHVLQWTNQATYNADADAAYNGAFYSRALAGGANSMGAWAGGGRTAYVYPGATTNYTFANGSTVTRANEAYVRSALTNVTDGASLFRRFCAGALTADGWGVVRDGDDEAAAAATGYSFDVAGYPTPAHSASDGSASCYFLQGAGYEDVAVLALLTFEPREPAEFQYIIHQCLNDGHDQGRSRWLLDMSANGGGYILLGYDLFRQLFPAVKEDGISRWRENAGFLAVARVYSAFVAGVDPATTADKLSVWLSETVFNARHDLDVADAPFASFAAKFAAAAPVHDTAYTALMRWNLDDPLTTYNYTYGLRTAVSGYGPLANLTAPPRDDLVLLYDGYCASTCTLASEMLRLQGGVRAVALGGRPATAGQPMQGVGGIKGAQIYHFRNILYFVQEARALLADGRAALADPAAHNATVAALARYSDLPLRRSSAASVNVRDQILRPNLADGLPAQYVREDADCRLYYTADMVADVSATWRAAADAAFRGGKCAAGSAAKPAAKPASKRAQPPPVTESAGNVTAVLETLKNAAFRPKDLPADELAWFDAQFNQKVY